MASSDAAAPLQDPPADATQERKVRNSFVIGINSRISADMCVVVGDNLVATSPYAVCIGPCDWDAVTEKLPTTYEGWMELLGQLMSFMDLHLLRNRHTGPQAVAALTLVMNKLTKIMSSRMVYSRPAREEERA